MAPILYHRPGSPEEAIDRLAEPGAVPLGGGSDLLVALRGGLVAPGSLVDLRSLPAAAALAWTPDDSLRIGASARLHDIATHPHVRESFPALADACEAVGSPALRNMGTLGGNLCQRSRCSYFRSRFSCLKSGGADCPAERGENEHLAILGGGPCHAVHPSDPAVALSALEATILVCGSGGDRSIPIADFFVPPSVDPRRETVLEPGEYVSAIEVPAVSAGGRQRYTKVLQRGAWDFAVVSMAVVRRTDGTVRLVLGGVAPAPWRASLSVEEDVAAGGISEDDLDALAERALYDAKPLSHNAYKVAIARALLRDAMSFASTA
jgi:xanthine dehydrogenase YagS FAD-binding subunit